MSATTKPAVIPKLYEEDKSWDVWINHFESVAEVCGWDDSSRLKWLRVGLRGKAGAAFRCLPKAMKEDYSQAKAALKSRFEPESRMTLY